MNLQQKNKTNRQSLFNLGFLLLIFAGCVLAEEEMNINKKGIMLQGYDPVAYFLENEPQIGWSSIQASHKGGTYYFVSEENRDRFIAKPEKYSPAYGGYCSYGIRMGKKFKIDPHSWKIVNGVLYMQLNQGTHIIWDKNLNQNISIADKVWPEIRSLAALKL